MQPQESHNMGDQKSPARSRYGLFFYLQHEGQRSYLRFTPLGATVIVLIIVIPITALLIMFFINSRTSEPQVNINITAPSVSPYSANTPIIRQAPPPSAPPNIKQPKYSTSSPPALPSPSNNTNERLAPKRTPEPTPSESPP